MKILILNNTSSYHNGCKAVMAFFKPHFANHQVDFYNERENFSVIHKDYDVIVCNGEGSMHHNKKKFLMRYMLEAKRTGKIVALVNSVWQEMDKAWANTINEACDYISVREVKSKKYLQSQLPGREIDVNLDLSYFYEVKYNEKPHQGLTSGGLFSAKPKVLTLMGFGEKHNVNVFRTKWEDLVNELRHTDFLVSGRHHEIYAALVAECPFLAVEGNTWKNSGMVETIGVDLPVLPIDVSMDKIKETLEEIQDRSDLYLEFFEKLKEFKKPNFRKELGL